MQSNSAVAVAETVQHFITAMDSLKLNMVAVDQVRVEGIPSNTCKSECHIHLSMLPLVLEDATKP